MLLTKALLEIQPWITEGLHPPREKKSTSKKANKLQLHITLYSIEKKRSHLIPQPQLLLTKLHTPTKALGNGISLLVQLARKLQTDTAKTRSALSMDAQGSCQLRDDIVEMPRFQTRPC